VKLVIYFGLMFVSLVVSVLLGYFQMKRTNKVWLSFLLALLSNIVILGIASIWWFFTETDGISQGLGVLYYCIVTGVIGIIDLIILLAVKGKSNNHYLND
jgi:peptidoglycan/LPS O-acetylase OafA/YrhL